MPRLFPHMEGAVSVVLKHQARKVAPHLAYKSGHQFIAATASLREENELVVVAFNEDRCGREIFRPSSPRSPDLRPPPAGET